MEPELEKTWLLFLSKAVSQRQWIMFSTKITCAYWFVISSLLILEYQLFVFDTFHLGQSCVRIVVHFIIHRLTELLIIKHLSVKYSKKLTRWVIIQGQSWGFILFYHFVQCALQRMFYTGTEKIVKPARSSVKFDIQVTDIRVTIGRPYGGVSGSILAWKRENEFSLLASLWKMIIC